MIYTISVENLDHIDDTEVHADSHEGALYRFVEANLAPGDIILIGVDGPDAGGQFNYYREFLVTQDAIGSWAYVEPKPLLKVRL